MRSSRPQLVAIYPELLGTYGDGGNLLVLQRRLEWRGIDCQVTSLGIGDPLPPSADLYVLGGGEDAAQAIALEHLRRTGLQAAVGAGAHVFAVCAGLQLLGHSFLGSDGARHDGLGLLDLTSGRLTTRAIGEVVVDPDPLLGLPKITGFENHLGSTTLGPACRPLGTILTGAGNDGVSRQEGAYQGTVFATYLHGPVLARNPALADLVLERSLQTTLEPLDRPAHDALRDDRLRGRM